MLQGLKERVRTFVRRDEGLTSVEYAVVAALVIVVVVAGLAVFGDGISSTFTTSGTTGMNGAASAP